VFDEIFSFHGNTITADTCENSMGVNLFVMLTGGAAGRQFIFTDNSIISASARFGSGIGTNTAQLIYYGSGDMTNATVTGNTITWYFKSYTSEAIEEARHPGYIECSGNTITKLA